MALTAAVSPSPIGAASTVMAGSRDQRGCLNAGGVAAASSPRGTGCSPPELMRRDTDSAVVSTTLSCTQVLRLIVTIYQIIPVPTKDPRRSRAGNRALTAREKPDIGHSRGTVFGNPRPGISRRNELAAREKPSIGHSRGAAFGNAGPSPSRRSEHVAKEKPSVGYSRGAAFGNPGPAPSRRNRLVAREKPSIGYSRGAAFGNPGV